MEVYCANCGQDRRVAIVERRETYPVRGEPITVDAKVAVCQTCHQDISVASLDDDNLETAFNQYRQLHGFLTAKEIVHLRERYDLSQRRLAGLLGWGAITIQRYENGGIQDVAHDQILRSLSDPNAVKYYLLQPSCRLTPGQRAQLEAALQARPTVAPWERVKAELTRAMNRGGIEQGFRSFDVEWLEQVVLWFAVHVPGELYKTKLAKLLWLADFWHFRRERVSLTGLAYARVPHGPMPDHYLALLDVMETDGVVTLNEDDFDPKKAAIIPREPSDDAEFSAVEMDTLRTILRHFGAKRAVDLSEESHQETTWVRRADGDIIPYTEADTLRMLDGLLVPDAQNPFA